jgi:hypothetical protein
MKTLRFGAVPHSFDGSSYYRIWLPMKHLEANSHHSVGVLRPGGDLPNEQEASMLDVLMFQRPAGKEGAMMLERLVGRTKLVYECDDDMLNATPWGLPHLQTDRAKESIKRCLRLCDAVTTTNEYLAETIRPYNENIYILPNHVKASLLDMQRPRRQRLTIGWAGGTSHLGDMMTVHRPMTDILDANPEVDMHFIGFDFTPMVGYRNSRWTAWSADVGHYYKNVDFDIAIAPSEDQIFNRSKTWLRALEMGALGIPIVAQNRLPYSDYVIDGKTGFLVDSDQDWFDRITDLINDADMREEMGAAAREQAAGYVIEDGWRLWEQAYESIAAT